MQSDSSLLADREFLFCVQLLCRLVGSRMELPALTLWKRVKRRSTGSVAITAKCKKFADVVVLVYRVGQMSPE